MLFFYKKNLKQNGLSIYIKIIYHDLKKITFNSDKINVFLILSHPMFAILAAITVMFGLSLARVPVVFALVIGAITGGLLAGLGLQGTLEAFNNG